MLLHCQNLLFCKSKYCEKNKVEFKINHTSMNDYNYRKLR